MATADAPIPVRHLDLPDGNPTERFVNDVPREGEGGVFSETWYPICLSTDLAPGAVIGRPFLDGRVIVFRGEDGYARVMSAYCPHLGADLSVGSVEGNHVVCAFHRWEYDANGRCVRTAIGDPAPDRARLFKYPCQERYGIIWAFNGSVPHWEIPSFEYPDEDIEVRSYRFEDPFLCDPWVFAANTPDMQHIKVVHGVKFENDDLHGGVEWSDWGLRYSFAAEHGTGVPIQWNVGIRGTSLFWQEGLYGDIWLGGMVGFGLPSPGRHEVFAALALRRPAGGPEADAAMAALFETAEGLMYRTINEDKDILNTIHYRPGYFTRGDQSLARYLKFVREYPRSHHGGPFLR